MVQTGVASHCAVRLSNDRDRASGCQILYPLRHDVRVGDVHTQKEQIVRGQVARERHNAVSVSGSHQPQADGSVAVERDRTRIVALDLWLRLVHRQLLWWKFA